MLDAAPHKGRRVCQTADLGAENVHQFGLGVRSAIGEGVFEVVPDALVRVELRSVGRESDEMQTRRVLQEFLYGVTSMNRTVVQEDDDMAADLAQQMAEERRDLLALDVVLVELAVQCAPETLRTDCDAGDGGDTVVAVPVGNDRCLADGTPRLVHRRDQEKTGLVYKDEVGAQPEGVFFTRGQMSRFHSSMATSLRSMARRSGFWWLQPNWCKSFPT
jgi:hypothetical protein